MSTLTHPSTHSRSGSFPVGLLVVFLSFLVLMGYWILNANEPIDIDASNSSTQQMASSAPDWNGKDKDERWQGKQSYRKCKGTAIEHILCGHGRNSNMTRKSKFLEKYSNKEELTKLADEVYDKGVKIWSEKRKVWEITHNFGTTVGETMTGNPTSIVKAYVDEVGHILTMFPF